MADGAADEAIRLYIQTGLQGMPKSLGSEDGMTFLRIALLFWRAHLAWPDYPPERVMEATIAAVIYETPDLPAEFLLTIAQHESDFQPGAVSWRWRNGKRADLVWTAMSAQPPDRPATCGYLQAMARDRAECAAIIADHGGMPAGVQELQEWSRMCRGDLGCIARGHAGGSRCAWDRRRCGRAARRISDHFVRATRMLQR